MRVSKGHTTIRNYGYTSQSKSDIESYVRFTASLSCNGRYSDRNFSVKKLVTFFVCSKRFALINHYKLRNRCCVFYGEKRENETLPGDACKTTVRDTNLTGLPKHN